MLREMLFTVLIWQDINITCTLQDKEVITGNQYSRRVLYIVTLAGSLCENSLDWTLFIKFHVYVVF